LLRAVAAFLIAPIFFHFAATVSTSVNRGTGIALWIGFGIALGGAALGIVIYALSGARPQEPDIDKFLEGVSPAWYSPPLLSRLRSAPPAEIREMEGVS